MALKEDIAKRFEKVALEVYEEPSSSKIIEADYEEKRLVSEESRLVTRRTEEVLKPQIPPIQRLSSTAREREMFIGWTGLTPEEWLKRFSRGEISINPPHGMTILQMAYMLTSSH